MTAVVYRHYNQHGKLLYIGCSMTFAARTLSHVYGSPWAKEIKKITLEHFDTKVEALEAEEAAIGKERPKHNSRFNHFSFPKLKEKQ